MKKLKKILLFVLILFATKSTIAQDDAYKGPAKMELRSFWRQMEMFKAGGGGATQITNAEKALAALKQKDPAYNTTNMEAELNKWKPGVMQALDAKKSDTEKAIEAKLLALNYNGPARNNVNAFWSLALQKSENISEGELKGRIDDLQYSFNQTKEKDPAFVLTEMENLLNDLNQKRKEMRIAKANAYNGDRTQPVPQKPVSTKPGDLFESIFENISLQLGGTSELPKAKEKIDAYKALLPKLVAQDYSDAKIDHTRKSKGNISGKKAVTERELDKVDDQLKEYIEKESMEYLFYTMQYHLAFWNAASTIFSEEPSYKEMYQKVTAAVNKIGSLEKLEALGKANGIEKIRNTKFPPAALKDAALEQLFINAFNKKYSVEFNGTAVKAVLTSSEWKIDRNELTGIVTGRIRGASVAYKRKDGKYFLINNFNILQEYVGGQFQKNAYSVFVVYSGSEMLEENVK